MTRPRSTQFSAVLDSQRAFATLSPDSFAGLAFAGANGPDQREKLLTAAELSWLDLSRCELAVLSACETSAGARSVGRGIASTQSAMLCAGARACIAALWPVRDLAADCLMRAFYRSRWEEGASVEAALRSARAELESLCDADGAPVFQPRDCAGFVLIRR